MNETVELHSSESPREPLEEIARDVYAIAQIAAIPKLLEVLCDVTGMGFAAVARVSDASWTVCAVQDKINFGLRISDQLPVESTLCIESKRSREPIVIDCASDDSRYRHHHTPKTYRIESYISVPIVLSNGHFFGNLCAVDPAPAKVSTPVVTTIFKHFASLIAFQLSNEVIVSRAYDALELERETSRSRNGLINEFGETFLSSLQAVCDASDIIDREVHDHPAVKGQATRIRTNALKMSSLTEKLLHAACPTRSTALRPKSPSQTTPPDEDWFSADKRSADAPERRALESLLMQRVGELESHLGRYDMYALTICKWLEGKAINPLVGALTIRTRGAWILSHLRLQAVPDSTTADFVDINERLLCVLARQDISARNKATIPCLRKPGERPAWSLRAKRDWYDFVGASDDELTALTHGIEGEIGLVASLYIRLAGWAGRLSLLPCWS